MSKERCLGCMKEYDSKFDVCPNCGHVKGTPATQAFHITPGSLLNDRYVIGKVLGYGGFGVTYIAWDNILMQKVAIKEYFPGDFATRIPGEKKITVYDGDRGEQFRQGMQRFLEEAQRLAKFNSTPGVVRIFDSFTRNDTAYIVMEYLEGEDVKHMLESRGGKLPFDEAIKIILPVLAVLKHVHSAGIIHRDISPDNVFVTKDGEVKLLDFGAARYATTAQSKSLSVILKMGYAPEEQYRSRGNQGPWSDVYAVAATLYRMITGIVPEESMERKANDKVKDPSKLGVDIPKSAENALMNAFIVNAEERTQTAEEFERQLLSDKEVERIIVKKAKKDVGRWPLWLKIFAPVAAFAAMVVGILIMTGVIQTAPGAIEQKKVSNVPNVIGMTEEQARNVLLDDEIGLTMGVGREYTRNEEEGLIFSQNPPAGATLNTGSQVEVLISKGALRMVVADVTDRVLGLAIQKLEEAGFKVKYKEVSDDETAEGAVVSQRQEAGVEFDQGGIITLIVSSGRETPLLEEATSLPDIIGQNFNEAKDMVLRNGLFIVISEEAYSDTVSKGSIISLSDKDGEMLPQDLIKGTVLHAKISIGRRSEAKAKVPDVGGIAQTEAIQILESQQFEVKIEEDYSETIAAGYVISQSITAGEEVELGTIITITVSLGPDEELSTPTPTPTKDADSTQKPQRVSGWVTKDEVPSGAEIADEKTQYCSREYKWKEGTWTDWYDQSQSGDFIESKTQYNTQTKETTTSTEASLSGWTQYDKNLITGEWANAWRDTPYLKLKPEKLEPELLT